MTNIINFRKGEIMEYKQASLNDWDINETLNKIIKKRGIKAGKRFSKCMVYLKEVANDNSNLLSELNNENCLTRIGVKRNGIPTLVTSDIGLKAHVYTFKIVDNQVIMKHEIITE